MTTVADIANRALQAIGAQATVTSIFPPDALSTEAAAVNILYTSRMQALMRAAHWNFARFQAPLSQLKAAMNDDGTVSSDPPPVPWLYEYAMPSDCLKARFIMPYFNALEGVPLVPFTLGMQATPLWYNNPAVPFIIGVDMVVPGEIDSIPPPSPGPAVPTKVILSNHPQAILVYTADYTQTPDIWDPSFAIAAETYLSMWLVNALARNKELWQDQARLVMEVVGQARVSDGNEGLTTVDHLPDWMRIRGALGAQGWYFDNQCYYGWDALGFPSGVSY
jgi:hypothetical protein